MNRRNARRPRRAVPLGLTVAGAPRLWQMAWLRANLFDLLLIIALGTAATAIIRFQFLVDFARRQPFPAGRWVELLGTEALLLVIFATGILYISRLEPTRSPRRRLAIAFGLLALAFTAGARVVRYFEASPYVLPLSAAGILLALFHSRRASLVLCALITLLIGIALQKSGQVDILPLLALFAGAALVAIELAQVRTRLVILEAGVSAAILQGIVLVGGWMAGFHSSADQATLPTLWQSLGRDLVWAGLNGLAVGVVLSAGLPVIELVFSTTTQIRLLELSDQNHLLMRRLIMEAPGTYHHSFIVGTLAEAAAEAIGCNPLLARVGAYFHDIGKLTRPDYFFENTTGGYNPHDHLTPTISALVIAAHPKDGVELGREYGLPKPILDIIEQHHGNAVIEYFYRRSLQDRNETGKPDEQFFRYTSPRPHTKEAGIVLLADGVEAASRTLVAPSASRLRRLVHDLLMDRLLDGQFDECDLRLAELHRIEESFVRTLCSLLHARIHYPPARPTPRRNSIV